MTHKPTLGFIGAGKVGHTLARLWYLRGFQVKAIYSQTPASADVLASQVMAEVVDSPSSVVEAADLTVLTVPDDAIGSVVGAIARVLQGVDEPRQRGIIHTSGAHDVSILASLAGRGFMTGGLHPVFPFADVNTAIDGLPGASFGVETEAPMLSMWLQSLVEVLKGQVIVIPAGQKAIYHSAFVFASNYVVTLYAIAERLLTDMGAERAIVDHALNTLLLGTVENLRAQGIPDALTGPMVRGDVGTIKEHQLALTSIDKDLGTLYKLLAQQTLPMVAARHIDTRFIEAFLNRGDHASDHS